MISLDREVQTIANKKYARGLELIANNGSKSKVKEAIFDGSNNLAELVKGAFTSNQK